MQFRLQVAPTGLANIWNSRDTVIMTFPINDIFIPCFREIHSNPPFHWKIVIYPIAEVIDKTDVSTIVGYKIPTLYGSFQVKTITSQVQECFGKVNFIYRKSSGF